MGNGQLVFWIVLCFLTFLLAFIPCFFLRKRPTAKEGEIELGDTEESKDKVELDLGGSHDIDLPFMDRDINTVRNESLVQPLSGMDPGVRDVRGGAGHQLTPTLESTDRDGGQWATVAEQSNEQVAGNMESEDEETNEYIGTQLMDRESEGRALGEPRRLSLSPRLSLTIPTMNRLARFATISNPQPNPSPNPSSIHQHRRAYSAIYHAPQTLPVTNAYLMPTDEHRIRPASHAIHRRWNSMSGNADDGESRPPTGCTYTDSLYTVSTLPSYPGSPAPPSYSDPVRTRSGPLVESNVISVREGSLMKPVSDVGQGGE